MEQLDVLRSVWSFYAGQAVYGGAGPALGLPVAASRGRLPLPGERPHGRLDEARVVGSRPARLSKTKQSARRLERHERCARSRRPVSDQARSLAASPTEESSPPSQAVR